MDTLTGRVVEFLESQRFVCAVVLGKKGSRYHLLTHLGREINLAPGRLLHSSGQALSVTDRNTIIRTLQEIHQHRDDLMTRIDIKDLWDLVSGEGDVWHPSDLAALSFSEEVTPDHEAALIRAVIEDHTYFKFREGMINVQDPEAVERLLQQRAAEQERLVRLSRGSQWLESLWSDASEGLRQTEVYSDDSYISYWIQAIKDYCIQGDESPHASEVRALFRQAGLSGQTAPFDTMVRAGVWEEDENLEFSRYQVDVDFPEEVLQQAIELAADRPDEIGNEGRVDLTGLHTVTIDGPESLDLDDAISFRKTEGGWEVGIHITDIGLMIEPGSPLFNEAVQRATSIYLPDQKVSMIPEVLSQGAWSLEQGKVRRALSFMAFLDDRGLLLRQEILRSVILVDERLTYEDVEKLMEERHPFSKLFDLCEARQNRRIERGALPLPIPELIIEVDEQGRVDVRLNEPGPARFLVAECMILANAVGARFLRDNDVPALYRSQAPPRDSIIDGYERDLMANYRQRRLISRGLISPEPEPHYGLGLDVYTTVTSPLRRALDLLMQQQITSFIRDHKPLHASKDLVSLSLVMQQGLMNAAAVRQARTRYWLLKHIEQRRGDVLKAWLLEFGSRKALAVLCDYLITVELPLPRSVKLRPDQLIGVRIKKVSPRENILKVDWAEI